MLFTSSSKTWFTQLSAEMKMIASIETLYVLLVASNLLLFLFWADKF